MFVCKGARARLFYFYTDDWFLFLPSGVSDSGIDNQFVPQQGVEQLFGGMPELEYDVSGSAFDNDITRDGEDTLDSFLKWNWNLSHLLYQTPLLLSIRTHLPGDVDTYMYCKLFYLICFLFKVINHMPFSSPNVASSHTLQLGMENIIMIWKGGWGDLISFSSIVWIKNESGME